MSVLCGFVSDRKLPAIVLGAFDERPAIHAKIKKLTYHTPSRIGFRVYEEIRKAAQAFPQMRDLKLLQRLVAALATNEGVQSKRTEILQRLKSQSSREVDVLCYILGGQLNREIAAELGVSERIIKAHRGRVMKKLGVRSTANYSQCCGVCYARADAR